ncbi:MAG TPA: hypothetical protein VHC43_05700 [Mycobacteriales bacterium]|nr:hypothetical protein [Mycobacteriales bacterium]
MFGRDRHQRDSGELEGELRESGQAATLIPASKVPHVLADGSVEWTFHVTLRADNETHKVEFSQRLPASYELRYPTLELPVLFDPNDPSRIALDISRLPAALAAAASRAGQTAGAAQDLPSGWTLPALCPHCGAPVDQAVQSGRADPHCDFCHEPLPVQGNPATG